MAGIYIHIPFCKQVCYYCDFHFSASLKKRKDVVVAIINEIESRKEYLEKEPIETIYFGGGTPSVLDLDEITEIIESIYRTYQVMKDAEITFEFNPEDCSISYLQDLKLLGVNRLSIGVQSFHDDDLRMLNRRHDSARAEECITNAQNTGFDRINIDLIYGLPRLTEEKWLYNLDKAINSGVDHVSAYHLSIEPRTVFSQHLKQGKLILPDEEAGIVQYRMLCSKMKLAGFIHYEISNFAKPGCYSRHNSSYWTGKKYLGIGPSAHSYNGKSRRWNVSNNSKYVECIANGQIYYEVEETTEQMAYNEYVMTSLRTNLGCSMGYIANHWGKEYASSFLKQIKVYIDKDLANYAGERIILTEEGYLLSNTIIEEVFK
jgi:oxygen-independent coproporphyrinogen III oxidase